MDGSKTSVSVDVDKQLLLKFKSLCVLKEVTMSEEIEKMVREWVQNNEGVQNTPPTATASTETPVEQPESSTEISDEIEDQVEKDIKL
jgi:hypothetical protein